MIKAHYNLAYSKNFGPLVINKIPDIGFSMTKIPIPGITLGTAQVSNGQTKPIEVPGDLEFEDVNIEFFIDENFENYKAIWDWCMILGWDEQRYSKIGDEWVDASFSILDNNSNPIGEVVFNDAFPKNLSEVGFATTENSTHLVSSFTLSYTYFDLKI